MNIKNKDGIFLKYCSRSYSDHIMHYCAKKKVTPNQVTLLGAMIMTIGIVSLFIAPEQNKLIYFLIPSIASYIQFVLDCVDGDLARYTQGGSKIGAFLDTAFDYFFEILYTSLLIYVIISYLGYSELWVAFIVFVNFLQFSLFHYYANATKDHSVKGERPIETSFSNIFEYIKENKITNSAKLLFSFASEGDIRRLILIIIPGLLYIQNTLLYQITFWYILGINSLLLIFIILISVTKLKKIDKQNIK